MAQRKPPATGEELHNLFHEVFLLHDALVQVMDAVHERAGLRTSQCKVADAIERLGAAPVPEIAASLGVSRQFVQTTCNEMEKAGLIGFRASPRHKRSKLASLTEKGRRVVARAGGAEAAIIEGALPNVDSDRVEDAHELLRTITSRVRGRKPR